MNLFEVKPDQTNVIIKINPLGEDCVELEYVRRLYKYAIFKANNWRQFWRIWHGNKRRLKAHKLEVVKTDGKYEIYLPLGWYRYQLTAKALEQLNMKGHKTTYMED